MSEQISSIPLEHLFESPTNPRKRYDDVDLAELAADIQQHGRILQPLLVRPRVPPMFAGMPDATVGYELVFGHRRLRAARLAGLTHAPCMVQDLSDLEVRRAQISENLQRTDVHPVEEAEGYQALMTEHGVTAEQLVEQTGKSRSYIYGRLTLLKACKEIREACLKGEIGTEVMLLIARLRTDKLQAKALAAIKSKAYDLGDGGERSFRNIRDLLKEKFTLALKGTDCIFDPLDAALLPDAGACSTCPKRTGNAPEFADLTSDRRGWWAGQVMKGEPELCTDPDCYDAKKTAHLAAEAAKLKAKGEVVIEGNKARAAVSAAGEVKGAFIALADVKEQLAKAKKDAKAGVVIAPPPVVLIQDPRTGKTHKAVRAEDLQQAGIKVQSAGKSAQAEHAARLASEREEQAKRAAKAAALHAEYATLVGLVRERVAQQERSAFDLGLVARVTLNGTPYRDRDALAKLWGCADFRKLEARLGSMSVADLTRLMMDCALVADTNPTTWVLGQKPLALLAAAKHYGVAPEPVQTPAPSASTPSKAARATGKAEAKASGVRYRNGATGETWSGRGLKPRWLAAELAKGKTLADFEATAASTAAGVTAVQGEIQMVDGAGHADASDAKAGALEDTGA